MRRSALSLFSCVILLGAPSILLAQAIPSGESLVVTVSPENPGPLTTVSVSVQSFSFDLSRATVSFTLNGKRVSSGIGLNSFSFQNGAVGERSVLVITADKQGGGRETKTLTFRPGTVDLLWQADSRVPETYRGKALASSGTLITITAVPNIIENGKRIAAERLLYTWKKNGDPIPNASGYGKQVINITGPLLFNTDVVSVTVTTTGGESRAAGMTRIAAVDPEIHLYEERPLEGIRYARRLPRAITLTAPEITVRAESFYFSKSDQLIGGVVSKWILNGGDFPNGPTLTLRQGQSSGRNEVVYSVDNPRKRLQRAKSSITISYKGLSQQ